MKVGDYVRTKKGEIGKIIGYINEPTDYYFNCYVTTLKTNFTDTYITEYDDNIKSSPNIIDLIEENDFVEIEYYSNRYKERITRIFEVEFINKNRDMSFGNGHCRLNMFYGEWCNQDKVLKPIIKSIVTKEQFLQMEYKVGE